MERFNLKKLSEVEGKKWDHVEISQRFAALENMDTEVDVDKTWESITENIKISARESLGYHELKKNKSCFDDGVQNYYTKVNKPNCGGYRIQAK
jgi:hypothetical protein